MSDENVWVDLDGKPLKFQDGVRVKINRPPEHPGRIDGWVRDYELHTDLEPAYEIYFLGDPPLRGVRESFLERQPPHMQNEHKHPMDRNCYICGWVPDLQK
jgi:hypothetical protein